MSTSLWWVLTQSFLAGQRMKKAEDERRETPQKEKRHRGWDKKRRKRASDMHGIFYLSRLHLKFLSRKNWIPHVSKPLQVIENSHHLPPRGSQSLAFINYSKLYFRIYLLQVAEFSPWNYILRIYVSLSFAKVQ